MSPLFSMLNYSMFPFMTLFFNLTLQNLLSTYFLGGMCSIIFRASSFQMDSISEEQQPDIEGSLESIRE